MPLEGGSIVISEKAEDLVQVAEPLDISRTATFTDSQSTLILDERTCNSIKSTSDLPSSKCDQYPVYQDDVIIAVMGPTGVGKSSFINKALGQDAAMAGHSLRSCTEEIRHFRCRYPDGSESNFVFVDTPGFDDTEIQDADILAQIAEWLKRTYKKGITLTGVLYLHRISDNRMSGAPLRNLDMFKKLCGNDCFRNIVLATTMWDEIDEVSGMQRQGELEQKYWKSMMKLGSQVLRFRNSRESAWDVIRQFPGVHRALLIQKEMVDQRKLLPETSAGRIVFYWLKDLIAFFRKLIEKWSRRRPEDDPTTVETEDHIAILRRLEEASGQLNKLGRSTQSNAIVESVLGPCSRPSTPSALSDLRPASLSDLHLSRLNTGSSSTSSSASLQLDEGIQLPDMRLAATITTLKVVKTTADIAPVPGLKAVTSLALTIVESIAGMESAQAALIAVAHNAGRLVLTISEHARTGHMPDHTERAIHDLVRELKSIQRIVKAANSRGRWQAKRFFLHPAEEQLAARCNERIQFAIYVFEIRSTLDIRQVLARMEERISQLNSS